MRTASKAGNRLVILCLLNAASATAARDTLSGPEVVAEEASIAFAGHKRAPEIPLSTKAFALLAAAGDASIGIDRVEYLFRGLAADLDGKFPVIFCWRLLIPQFTGIDRVLRRLERFGWRRPDFLSGGMGHGK